MRSLVRFFVQQSLFGNLLTAIVFLTGIYSVITIRKDLFPPVEFDVTLVTAILPGAAPDQVEKLIVNPLEQALREVDGVKKVQSSAVDSRAVITLTLDPDARNPEKTNQDIQRAVDRVESYPSEAEKPVVQQLESGQTPVIELSIVDPSMPTLELRELVRDISDELSQVPGVAKVIKSGWRKKENVVELNPKALAIKQVSIAEVIQSLKLSNVQLPAGDMSVGGDREVAVKTDGEFRDTEAIANSPIRKNFEGFGVRIKDVGRVYEALEDPNLLLRANGQDSFSLIILKKPKADALKTVAAVQEKMKQLQGSLPPTLQYRFINDFTEYLNNRLGTLGSNMLVGIILVLIVLTLFLPWRVALVVSAGIPFSMLAALTLLKSMGFSLNLISMIGLIIVSGMLVDDAIVVVENIFRRIEKGEEFRTAIIEGTAEMIPPVTASVLTTVAAFSPMLFMSGIFGKFVFEIPVMVIVPLVVSLIEAFIVSPVHFTEWVGQRASLKIAQSQMQASNKAHWYDGVLQRYTKYVRWSLRNKSKVFVGSFGVLIAVGLLTTQMKFILFPPDGVYSFFVRIDGPPGMSIEKMSELIRPVEAQIAKLPPAELRDFVAQIGVQQNEPDDPFTKRAAHYAQIQVNLTPENQRVRSVTEVVDALRETIALPAGATKLHYEILKGGPPQGKPISINISGDDFVVLREIAEKIKLALAEVEGVTDIDDSEVRGKKEVKVTPRTGDLARLGITTQDVATTVRAAFAGIPASSIRTLDEEVDIRVKLAPSTLNPADQLEALTVGNAMGNLIPVSKITDFSEAESQLLVQHEKFKRVLVVGAQVDLEKTTALDATKKVKPQIDEIMKKYPRYKIEFGGENEDTQESMQSLLRSFAFAGIMIFAILIITFGSFTQPLLVMFAIPLGFVGTMLGLFIHGMPISFMAMLGIIALAGVIVNNAIVMIDFYNTRRKEGLGWEQAVVDAATVRLRPVILTSLTTVLGLLPTAYGIGGNDGFVAALALSLGWGLFIGSILTMLFFPALLGALESFKDRRKKIS